MKTLALAAVVLAATVGVARAENVCPSEIERTVSDWKAIHLVPADRPAAISKGDGMHAHVQQAVDSMRYHLKMAKDRCREGKDHESLLHLDVIRAFLNLPEIQHPVDHRYLYKERRT